MSPCDFVTPQGKKEEERVLRAPPCVTMRVRLIFRRFATREFDFVSNSIFSPL